MIFMELVYALTVIKLFFVMTIIELVLYEFVSFF